MRDRHFPETLNSGEKTGCGIIPVYMEKFTEYKKLSKKKKKELNSRKRVYWTICPVTRKPSRSKAYKRSRKHPGTEIEDE